MHINIPFTDALSEMHAYVKFLTKILAKKRSIPELFDDFNTMSLTNEYSAIKKNLPVKLNDPGRFAITIDLGSPRYKALCDLGVSTSVLPLCI